jgi:peroxiredoxin
MEPLVIVGRLLLAGVFALAGIAKLVDRNRFRQTLIAFGVPARPATPLAVALPLAELVVAGALLTRRAAWWGGGGALVLLLAFLGAVTVNLLRGRRPACGCFGQRATTPIGWSTVIRNSMLAMTAAVVVLSGPERSGPGFAALVGVRGPAGVLALVGTVSGLALVTGVGWVVAHLVRQQGRLLRRLEVVEAAVHHEVVDREPDTRWHQWESMVGQPAPPLRLPDLNDRLVDLAELRGQRTLVLFWNTSCGFCNQMLPDLRRWDATPPPGSPRLLVVSHGPVETHRSMGLRSTVVLDNAHSAAAAFGARGTPSAVLLDSELTIASDVAVGRDAVMALAEPVPAVRQ